MLTMARVNGAVRYVMVHRTQHALDENATVVYLADNAVRVEMTVTTYRRLRPDIRQHAPGKVLQHIAMTVHSLPCDDDPGFVGVLAATHRRVNCYYDAYKLGRQRVHAVRLDSLVGPQCALNIL